jgi:PAS domain S-box-containing protein
MEATVLSYLPSGQVLSVDEHFTTLFGYTKEEVIGNYLQDIIYPSPYREAFIAVLSSFRKTGKPELRGILWQMQAKHKDGTIFHINQTQCAMGEGDSMIFIANIQKIQFDTCTISFDLKGTILLCASTSLTVLEFFGERKLLGKKLIDIAPKLLPQPSVEGAEPGYLFLTEGVLPGEYKSVNVQILGKEGSLENMLLQVRKINLGAIGIVFSATFNRVNPFVEVLLLVNSSDLITACSSQVLPVLGYSEDQLIGKHLDFLLPESTDQQHSSSSDEHSEKKRGITSPSIWRDESVVAKVLEVRHCLGTTMSVVCNTLPLPEQNLSVLLRKVKGTDLAPESQVVGKYTIGKLIAVGSYGKVKKAYRTDSGNEVAVKILNKKLMNSVELARAFKEIEILSKLQHSNIIQFFDLVETKDRLYLFMEFMKGSVTLTQYMETVSLSEDEAKKIFHQIVLAVEYCHKLRVIHRDIKAPNILIRKSEVKLIDFGLSAIIESGNLQHTFCGSPAYSAPEMLLGNNYAGKPVDIWSLGVLLYLMVSSKLPFDCLQKILACEWVQPDNVSDACKDLLSRMMVVDPLARSTIQDILVHPWFM